MASTIDPKKLKLHPANLEIYQTRKSEDEELRESIREHGILEPLVINSRNVIISGARRWKAALDLGLKEVPCRVEDYEDEELAIIHHNRYRQKTWREIHNEYKIIKEREAPKAADRKKATQFVPGEIGKQEPQNFVGPTGEVLKIGAKETGVSREQLRQLDYVYSREEDEKIKPIVEKLDRNEIKPYKAYEMVKRFESPQSVKPKTFKCRACQQEYEEPWKPVNVTLCPDCEAQFLIWLAERQ